MCEKGGMAIESGYLFGLWLTDLWKNFIIQKDFINLTYQGSSGVQSGFRIFFDTNKIIEME